jgi:peptide/nickel transport system ATP-binding protein
VDLAVKPGEFVAVVGPSGCGKSTLLKIIAGLLGPSEGKIEIAGNVISGPHTDLGIVFQSPVLLDWRNVLDNVLVQIDLRGGDPDAYRERAMMLLAKVGLAGFENRMPRELSGGMRQRAMIAMALVNNPSLLIADEPTTALDVTVQSQILSLLKDLQIKSNMAIILITHDLGVVAEFADRICVMYGGRIVEDGTVEDIFYRPKHPYTLGLLNSVPRITSGTSHRLKAIPGQPPSLINLPKGCSFEPRCEYVSKVPGGKCETEVPSLDVKNPGHLSRCFLSTDLLDNLAKDKA